MSVIETFDADDLAGRFDVAELQTFVATHFGAQLRPVGDEIVLERVPESSGVGFTDLDADRRQQLGDYRRASGMDSSLGDGR